MQANFIVGVFRINKRTAQGVGEALFKMFRKQKNVQRKRKM